MRTELTLAVPYEWVRAREVRERVGQLLAEVSDEVLARAQIVATELMENALKYGTHVSAQPNVVFHLCLDDDRLRIEVTQGVRSADSLTALQVCLASVAADTPPEELYLARLEAIASGSIGGGLGLYRVAHEGGFRLGHRLERNVLTVIAERRLEQVPS